MAISRAQMSNQIRLAPGKAPGRAFGKNGAKKLPPRLQPKGKAK